MFSTTTMASSTTNPVEMVNAMSERLSRLNPARYITPKVPMSDTTTAMLGMNMARRSRRKTKTTPMTRTTDRMRVRCTSSMEARMVLVRSITTLRSITGGMEAFNCGISFVMASTVLMMFAPGSRETTSSTEGLPLA